MSVQPSLSSCLLRPVWHNARARLGGGAGGGGGTPRAGDKRGFLALKDIHKVSGGKTLAVHSFGLWRPGEDSCNPKNR